MSPPAVGITLMRPPTSQPTLTSVRPYKPAWPLQAALDHVLARRGTQFEPECVDAMEIAARTLPADWQGTAQAWGLQMTLELGRPARVLLDAT